MTGKPVKKVETNQTTETDFVVIKNPEITIDREFSKLIPPLFSEEYEDLEESIRQVGLDKPIQIWVCEGKNILVDGHNRYGICTKHKIDYYARVVTPFESREAAKKWILKNQKSQRNLTPFQLIEVVLKLKDIIAAEAKENQKKSGGSVNSKLNKPVVKKINTYNVLAERASTSPNTVRHVEKIMKKHGEGVVSKEELDDLRRGKVKVFSIYKKYCIPEPAAVPKEDDADVSTEPPQTQSDDSKSSPSSHKLISKPKPGQQEEMRRLPPEISKAVARHLSDLARVLMSDKLNKRERRHIHSEIDKWLEEERTKEAERK